MRLEARSYPVAFRVDVQATLAFTGAADLDGNVVIDGGVLSATTITNSASLDFFDGVLQADTLTVDATGVLSGAGDVFADVINDNDAIFIADTLVVGDYTNNGTTTVQSGTLTITGSVTNNGTIIGDIAVGPSRGGGPSAPRDALVALGDLLLGPMATFDMPSSGLTVKAGGSFDAAINANTRFDMADATLQMVGLEGTTQRLEMMSLDIGDDPLGLDRTIPGHFPIGTLRIGPTPAFVDLRDARDNDRLGQDACEALYVRDLIVDRGATLSPNACTVYYVTVDPAGTIINPERFDQIVLLFGDHDADGDVDMEDTLHYPADCMTGPDNGPPPLGCEVFDFNNDDDVDMEDFATLLQTLDAAAD